MPLKQAPWWMYAVAGCFLCTFAFNVYEQIRGPEPPFRFYQFVDESLLVEVVQPNTAAERAGVRVGDRVLTFDGNPASATNVWDALTLNLEVGRPYRVEIERAGQRQTFAMTLQPRAAVRARLVDRVLFGLAIADAMAFLLLGIFVAFSRPFDRSARLGALILGLLMSYVLAGTTGSAVLLRQLPLPVGVLAWLPSIAAGFLFPGLFFTFCATFPRPLFRSRVAWALALAPNLLFIVLAIPFFFYVTFINPGAAMQPNTALPLIGGATLLGYMVAALAALVLNYRRLDLNEKRRVRVLVGGTVLGFVGTVAPPILLLSEGLVRVPETAIGAVFTSPEYTFLVRVLWLALPISWAYAILRHRLFDIGVMVRQGLQYALARRVLMTIVPALVVLLVADLLLHSQQPLAEILRARGWIYVTVGALTLTANVKRQDWLDALDRRFFRERYDAHGLLREVVEEVRGARSFPQVAQHVVQRIHDALHPEFVVLFAREPREPGYRCLASAPAGCAPPALSAEGKLMALVRLLGKPLEVPQTSSGWLKDQLPAEESTFLREARIEWLVPVALAADRSEAVLVLGGKLSEEPYAREDQDLLVAIAASLALVLEKEAGPVSTPRDVFEECPECGRCYDAGATQCGSDGRRLVPVMLPRHLDGRYLLQQRLGRGGMGTVYAASDSALERRVAVKVIRENLVGSAEAAERFRREARAAAGFSHPNVVTVHDFGVVAGNRAFLVMELLEGTTLREALHQERRVPTSRAVAIVGGISAALTAAHRRQLVHRDLKPENVFLTAGEHGESIKVLDFGIAKFLTQATEQPTGETSPGAVIGTPRYMSPEQWRGEEARHGWDVWALGVIAYEMFLGAHPFETALAGDWAGAMLAGRFTPVAARLPDAPPTWQAFFERTFSPWPDRRPQSAEIFAAELTTLV